jgi:ABC-2 type transport system permease protein
MRWALWAKTFNDAWVLTAAAGTLLFVFSGLYVFMGSQFEDEKLNVILANLPDVFSKVTPIPLAQLVTPLGRIAGLLVDPTLFLTCGLWAVARGSDAVSGELNRGTMEMLLAQPVPRYQIVLVQAVVTTLCAALLCCVVLAGCTIGLWLTHYKDPVDFEKYARGVFNLFCLNYVIAAVTTLLSSVDRYRWRTLALGGGFMVTQLIVKVLSRLKEQFEPLRYCTVYGAYEPWWLIDAKPDEYLYLWFCLNGTLLAIGTLSFVLATIIFCRRDLPAPL